MTNFLYLDIISKVFLPALLLLFDLIIWSCSNYFNIFLLRSLFYAEVLRVNNFWTIGLSGFFVLLESFLITGYFAVDLIVMVPVFFLAQKLRSITQYSLYLYSFLALLFLFVHYLVIDCILSSKPIGLFINLKTIAIHCIIVLLINVFFKRQPR